MKGILIVLFICFVAIDMVQGSRKSVDECAEELNIQDVEKFHKGIDLDEYLKNPTDDVTCMLACDQRKMANANGTTLYKRLLQVVDEAYKQKFENSEFTRKDVESKINNCFLKEREECEFFKCVEPFKSPFAEVFVYDLLLAITSGFANSLSS